MSANTCSVRLSTALLEDARREAEVFHRTISGQLEHWVKLGQAFEAAPGCGMDRVRAALIAADTKPNETPSKP